MSLVKRRNLSTKNYRHRQRAKRLLETKPNGKREKIVLPNNVDFRKCKASSLKLSVRFNLTLARARSHCAVIVTLCAFVILITKHFCFVVARLVAVVTAAAEACCVFFGFCVHSNYMFTSIERSLA